MAACTDFTSAAVATDSRRTAIVRFVKGEAPSAEQVATLETALRDLAQKRVAFAKLVRAETGHDSVTFTLEKRAQSAKPGAA